MNCQKQVKFWLICWADAWCFPSLCNSFRFVSVWMLTDMFNFFLSQIKTDVENELARLSLNYSSINSATETFINCIKRTVGRRAKYNGTSQVNKNEAEIILEDKKAPIWAESHTELQRLQNNLIKISKQQSLPKQIITDDKTLNNRNLWKTVKKLLTGRSIKE